MITYKSDFCTKPFIALNLHNLRFKTEAEFIKCFGLHWRDIVCWNNSGKMDYLFGHTITDFSINEITDDRIFIDKHINDINGWKIRKSMLLPVRMTTREKLEYLYMCVYWRESIPKYDKEGIEHVANGDYVLDEPTGLWLNNLYNSLDTDEIK